MNVTSNGVITPGGTRIDVRRSFSWGRDTNGEPEICPHTVSKAAR